MGGGGGAQLAPVAHAKRLDAIQQAHHLPIRPPLVVAPDSLVLQPRPHPALASGGAQQPCALARRPRGQGAPRRRPFAPIGRARRHQSTAAPVHGVRARLPCAKAQGSPLSADSEARPAMSHHISWERRPWCPCARRNAAVWRVRGMRGPRWHDGVPHRAAGGVLPRCWRGRRGRGRGRERVPCSRKGCHCSLLRQVRCTPRGAQLNMRIPRWRRMTASSLFSCRDPAGDVQQKNNAEHRHGDRRHLSCVQPYFLELYPVESAHRVAPGVSVTWLHWPHVAPYS